jgi:KDO2-lipid IV(A) lauroyltransferase
MVEIFYGYRVSDAEMRERVVFENMEVLEELARQKHGVIAYLGHMCNWEWLADVGKQFADKSIVEYNVYRKQKNQKSDEAMLLLRSKRGGECVEKNVLLRKLVQLRRADHPFVIGLIADQKPSPRNAHIWTTFLNQDTSFLDGGEVLSRKFDLGVVYANITSPKRGYYRIHFEVITDDPQSMPENEITLSYVRMIEANIRQQPERWLWTHNRWKWGKPTSNS